MKRLVFALGAMALGCAAVTPASADYAVVKFKNTGYCRAWYDHTAKPWGDLAGSLGERIELGRGADQGRLRDDAQMVQRLGQVSPPDIRLHCRRPPASRQAAFIL
jgi:hypothetical protein